MADYIFGKGKLYIGSRTAQGTPTQLKWAGDCSNFAVSLASEKAEIKENYTGQNLTAATVNTGKSATLNIELKEATIDNLTLALFGVAASTVAGTITGEDLGAAGVGELVPFSKSQVSAVVVKDGLTTLVEGTDYVLNAAHGSIEMKVAGVALTASYTHGAQKQVALFGETPADKYIRFEGKNLAKPGEALIVELYKVRFNPLQELSLIGDDFGGLAMDADVLIDDTKDATGEFGLFGRVIKA